MRHINLSSRLLSDAVWSRIFEHAAARRLDRGAAVDAALGGLDRLRSQAQYNTGSIGTAAQWALYSLAHLWRPAVIAEVGTFIGKSAFAMAMGAEAAGVEAEVHTCDMSNRFDLPQGLTKCLMVQYQGTPSTQMLTEMVEDGFAGRVDLFHFDGRLQKEDLGPVTALASPEAIVVLDDFEGAEKGVANLFALRATPMFRDHVCVYPPGETLLRRLGFWDHATCALLVSRQAIQLTAQ